MAKTTTIEHVTISGVFIAFYSSLILILPERFGLYTFNLVRLASLILACAWLSVIIAAGLAIDERFETKMKTFYSKLFTICNILNILWILFLLASYAFSALFIGI